MTRDPEQILRFWFGGIAPDGKADAAHAEHWWQKDDAFDATIRERFLPTWQAAMRGDLDAWLQDPRGRLAYVIVLDQFSRNMFRGTPEAFAGDPRALAAAREGIELGHDRALVGEERVFLYMPFEHSERIEDQERCIALFTAFRDETEGPLRAVLEANVGYAERHREIIARWGRFPHRNAILGRASTPEELTFLTQPNSSF
jgi:uncharacterized protein (DUF924 family)